MMLVIFCHFSFKAVILKEFFFPVKHICIYIYIAMIKIMLPTLKIDQVKSYELWTTHVSYS